MPTCDQHVCALRRLADDPDLLPQRLLGQSAQVLGFSLTAVTVRRCGPTGVKVSVRTRCPHRVTRATRDLGSRSGERETLITHPEVSVFVLVAGDGDYTPLMQRLREFGKHVVGVGTEANASPRLVSVCSEYKRRSPGLQHLVRCHVGIRVYWRSSWWARLVATRLTLFGSPCHAGQDRLGFGSEVWFERVPVAAFAHDPEVSADRGQESQMAAAGVQFGHVADPAGGCRVEKAVAVERG